MCPRGRPGRAGRSVGRQGEPVTGRVWEPGLSRRGVLAAAALVTLPVLTSGCGKGFGALGPPPRPLPEVGVLTRAISREHLMIARYQAVVSGFPALAGELGPLLAEHRAHLTALHSRLLPGAKPAPVPSSGPPIPAGPADRAAAIAGLRAAEDRAARALLDSLAVASPSLAQLLASIAASEATHAAALTRPGVTG